jgi:hypothetical protein
MQLSRCLGILTGTFEPQLSRSCSKPEYSKTESDRILVFTNKFHLNPQQVNESITFVSQNLSDPQIEVFLVCIDDNAHMQVRELARIAFCSVVKSTNSDVLRLAQIFAEVIKSNNKTSEAGIARHGAVLGLSALVATSPYEVATWMPGLLVILANYYAAKDVLPVIKATIKDTFAEFWRFLCSNFASLIISEGPTKIYGRSKRKSLQKTNCSLSTNWLPPPTTMHSVACRKSNDNPSPNWHMMRHPFRFRSAKHVFLCLSPDLSSLFFLDFSAFRLFGTSI